MSGGHFPMADAPVPVGRVDSLDALRGILALSVMGYHLLIWRYDVHLLALGSYAVYTFFVLSGFAMAWVSVRFPPGGFPVREFFIARGARILPLWWLAVIGTVLSALPTRPDLGKLMENLTLLSALTPTSDIPLGGWSIEIEVVFYLLFPLAVVLLRGPRAMAWLFVATLAVRVVYLRAIWQPGDLEPDSTAYYQIPTFLAFFAGGMLVAEMRRSRPAVSGSWPFAAGLVVLAGVFATGTRQADEITSTLPLHTILAGPLGVLQTLACIGAVALVSFAPNPANAFWRRLAETLGGISFATYLLHPLVYTAVNKVDERVGFGDAPVIVLTVVLTIVASWCSYRYFEMPARRFIRNRLARPAGERVTP